MRSVFMMSLLGLALTVSTSAFAGELDNESNVTNQQAQLATDLPATLVIRVNETTQDIEVLHSNNALPAGEAAKAVVDQHASEFKKIDVKSGMTGELERDSSRSSWYFCFPTYNWYSPSYYYYGYSYSYSQYYWYNWGGYNYYYYRWSYGW